MRNKNLEETYMKINEIPEKGLLEEIVITDSINAAKDSLALYSKGATAKPGTIPSNISLKIQTIVQKISNPNAVDREMFRGASNREKDVISMIARLFDKNENDDLSAGYLLSGGSESLNQVSYMLRNKFFQEKIGINIRTKGLAAGIIKGTENKIEKTNNYNIFKPRILLPVNYHFCGIKSIDLLGLGIDSLAYYDLDEDFNINQESLIKTITEIYNKGDDIIFSLGCAGDTTHGKVHDIKLLNEISEDIAKKFNKKAPPIIADAAGSYIFLGLMKDSKIYDGYFPKLSFNINNLEAIVGDPHKQPLPYSSGLLLLRDMNLANYTDVRNITTGYYLDMDENSKDVTAALATIPTSRSGTNAFTIWAYMVNEGLNNLRTNKENIWSLVKNFKEYIKESKNYELICEPQTQVVPFKFKGTGKNNIDIYREIKQNSKDSCYISSDTNILVKTKDELKKSEKSDIYTGLFATFMEHNTKEHIEKLKSRLEEVAYLIKNEK